MIVKKHQYTYILHIQNIIDKYHLYVSVHHYCILLYTIVQYLKCYLEYRIVSYSVT